MLSQFFILSARGDTLAFRDFRGDVVRGTPEIFYRRIKSFKGVNPPPIFHVEGTHFLHIIQAGLYFVCTTTSNVAPVFVLELLNKISQVCKDYCGVLHEESIRSNFALIYEILDEILDFGYPQCTSTEMLKDFIFNEAHQVQQTKMRRPQVNAGVFGVEKRSLPSSAPNKSVIASPNKSGKNEVFIDILESLTILVAATGHVIRSEIDGCIKVRSFLAGTPEIRMCLNENIKIRNSDNSNREMSMNDVVSSVLLDDCCFHDCIDNEEFEKSRCLVFKPPGGECKVMSYRIIGDIHLPFRVHPFLEVIGDDQIALRLKLTCDVPKMFNAVSIVVRVPVPKSSTNVTHETSTGANTFEYKAKEKLLYWNIKRMDGGTEHSAYIKFTVPLVTNMCKKQVGPISLEFEFPMFVCSKLQIKFLKVNEKNSMYTPMRWVRYITHSDSYVTRI